MVTAQINRSAGQIQNTLEGRNVESLAVLALSTASGVIVAQSITDRIMMMLDRPINPQGVTDYALSVGIKGALALGLGMVAANVSGLGMIAAAFLGLGGLVSAGADLMEGMLTTSPLGSDNPLAPPQSGSTSSRPRRSRSQSSSSSSGNGNSSSSSSSSGQTAASAGW